MVMRTRDPEKDELAHPKKRTRGTMPMSDDDRDLLEIVKDEHRACVERGEAIQSLSNVERRRRRLPN